MWLNKCFAEFPDMEILATVTGICCAAMTALVSKW